MIVSLPPPPPSYSALSLTQMLDTLRRAFLRVVSQDEAASRILLTAPNGTIYSVTVDNSGTLVTAVNDGKSRI